MKRSFALSAAFALAVGLVSAPAQATEPEILQVQPHARIAGGVAHTVFLAPDGRVAPGIGASSAAPVPGTSPNRCR